MTKDEPCVAVVVADEFTLASPTVPTAPAAAHNNLSEVLRAMANDASTRDIDAFIKLDCEESNFSERGVHKSERRISKGPSTSASPRKSTSSTHQHNNLHVKQDIDGFFNGVERANCGEVTGNSRGVTMNGNNASGPHNIVDENSVPLDTTEDDLSTQISIQLPLEYFPDGSSE